MVNIVSRSGWDATPWQGSTVTVSLSQRTEFMMHYDGGVPIYRTGVSVPQAIERTHLNNGWSGIGYNFVVDQNGTIFEGRGWSLQGAHCPGHNTSAFGVQIAIGGDQRPSEAALNSARALYDEACRRTGRTLRKLGHNDGYATSCPGPHLDAWVENGMPADGSAGGGTPITLGDDLIGAQEGDKGEVVVAIQRLIGYAGHGDKLGSAGVDGIWGPGTSAGLLAVRKSVGSSVSVANKMTGSAYAQLIRAVIQKEVA